jgi:hypothetical protein
VTKLEELSHLSAELELLLHHAKREEEIFQASRARLQAVNDKVAKLVQRVELVRRSTWE